MYRRLPIELKWLFYLLFLSRTISTGHPITDRLTLLAPPSSKQPIGVLLTIKVGACGCDVDRVNLFCSWCSSLAVQFPDVFIQLTFVYLLSQYSVVSSFIHRRVKGGSYIFRFLCAINTSAVQSVMCTDTGCYYNYVVCLIVPYRIHPRQSEHEI